MRPGLYLASAVFPAYWLALAADVDSELLTRWAHLALMAVPTAVVVARAARDRHQRAAWSLLGAGLALWTLGFACQLAVAPRSPGVAHALWLGGYPSLFAAFVAFARPWLRRAPITVAFDTLAVGLGVTAVVTALVVPLLVANGGRLGLGAVVSLGYPLSDSLLLAVAVIGAVIAGRGGGAMWLLMASGAAALLIADALWARHTAAGDWAPAMSTNAVYPLWPAFAAVAAGLPAARRCAPAGVGHLRTQAAALVAALSAVVLLLVNEWAAIPAASVVLAALALIVGVHRTGLAMVINLRESLTASRERELIEDVRQALREQAFELHFQPLVDTATGAVRGAEALLRWPREGRFVPPEHFLGAVEHSDQIRPLTDYVLDRALAALARWRRDGHDIGVSVNLATANLLEPDLPGRVIETLCRHGVEASALTLEITETAQIDDSALAGEVLAALDRLGVGLSVDDFGTGHSSLARLARFPIRELKIDRSFVQGMHTGRRPIVAPAIELARALGLRTVAEGVEDRATLDALRELECDLAQGYFISRPLPAAEFAAWLAAPRFAEGPARPAEAERAGDQPTAVSSRA